MTATARPGDQNPLSVEDWLSDFESLDWSGTFDLRCCDSGPIARGTVTTIPEPSTAFLLSGGLVGLALKRRRLH